MLHNTRMLHDADRSRAFLLVWVAYLAAIVAALLVGIGLAGRHPIELVLAADLAATFVVFGFSMAFDNSSFYDPYWSVAPPLIGLAFVCTAEAGTAVPARQALVLGLVALWALRLTWNWARGWSGLHHEDWRYVDLYAQGMPKWFISFFGIHFFPTVMVLLGCLALIPSLAYGDRTWRLLDSIALIVTAGAILIETVADEQLRSFNRRKQHGEIVADGLWAYSRHPNYFGEQSFWWGLFLFGFAANPHFWWTIIGPIAMTTMFHFASVPMLDRRSLARRPGYEEHMRRVNAVVPWFPRA